MEMIAAWKKILTAVFINFGLALKTSVSEWTGSSHMSYGALTDSDEGIVYVPQGPGWLKYSRTGRYSRHKFDNYFLGNTTSIPNNLFPTTIVSRGEQLIIPRLRRI